MYTICLDIEGRCCVVVGGGSVAGRKIDGVLARGAVVRVVSPKASAKIRCQAEKGMLEWRRKKYEKADLEGAFLVFATTSCREVQQVVEQDARDAGILVNVADRPGTSDFHVPATFFRGDLEVAISTNGTSPAIAARVRQLLEQCIGEEYGTHLAVAAQLRERIISTFAERERADIFREISHPDVTGWIKKKQWKKVEAYLHHILGTASGINWDLYGQQEGTRRIS